MPNLDIQAMRRKYTGGKLVLVDNLGGNFCGNVFDEKFWWETFGRYFLEETGDVTMRDEQSTNNKGS